MVIRDLKKEITDLIGARDAQLLITSVLDISITDFMLGIDKPIDNEAADMVKNAALRVRSGEPLQYVVGKTEFMSLQFYVSSGVLIPRPDTETIVELAIDAIGNNSYSVLDIGSGSGCVAISIAHYCPDAKVTSIDISNDALKIAEQNAKNNGVKVNFKSCDILNSLPEGKFDLVVSNPPYIPTNVINALDRNVKDFEPIIALDGGTDGLVFYRRIVDIAPDLLNKNGMLMFEVGHDQAELVRELMDSKFTDIKITNDLCGIGRVVSGMMLN